MECGVNVSSVKCIFASLRHKQHSLLSNKVGNNESVDSDFFSRHTSWSTQVDWSHKIECRDYKVVRLESTESVASANLTLEAAFWGSPLFPSFSSFSICMIRKATRRGRRRETNWESVKDHAFSSRGRATPLHSSPLRSRDIFLASISQIDCKRMSEGGTGEAGKEGGRGEIPSLFWRFQWSL